MRPAIRAGFVHPVEAEWLQLALSAEFAGFFAPILIGPEARIRDAAAQAGLDISRLAVANTPDDTGETATCAVELARGGAVQALVRCNLANEDLLARVAATGSGLRAERRLSHAHYVDLPGRAQGMLLADAMLNLTPTLGAKRDMVRNTTELAMALGVAQPHVAILSAVGIPSAALVSSIDAQALKAMAAQGLFGDVVLDGPLTLDAALSLDFARAQGVTSEVAGHADVLIAPTMESAALLLRAMTSLAGGFAAGIVLGAQLPIVAPARLDALEARMAACVLASLYANRENVGDQAGKPAVPVHADAGPRGQATAG